MIELLEDDKTDLTDRLTVKGLTAVKVMKYLNKIITNMEMMCRKFVIEKLRVVRFLKRVF